MESHDLDLLDRAEQYDQETLKQTIDQLSEQYHNDISTVEDATFDRLVSMYEQKFGEYKEAGAPPRGEKVTLPYYLAGLKKAKIESELNLWVRNYPGPYVVQDKIDGLTLLYVVKYLDKQKTEKLYTRGDFTVGRDVSHLIPYLNLPNITFDIAVRGEGVITYEDFERIGTGFKNIRNMVSGIVNAKDSLNTDHARNIKFVTYRIVDSPGSSYCKETAEQQILRLSSLGFTVPWACRVETFDYTQLEGTLQHRKQNAPYDIDGLVLYQDKYSDYPVGEMPKHVIAFKSAIATVTAVTVVTEVTWKASKDKLLKPVVHYQPVVFPKFTLQKATGYNGRFIISNGIGPGAIIEIIRSGDVIPKITKVIKPSQMIIYPDLSKHGQYTWDETQVEFVLLQNNDEVFASKLEYFLEKLEVKNFGPTRVAAFVNAGIKTIYQLLTATPQMFTTIDRVGTVLANQIYNDLQSKVKDISLAKIMTASGIFPNVGEKKFNMIISALPNLLEMAQTNQDQLVSSIQAIKGFDKTAFEIAAKLPVFIEWLAQHPMITVKKPRIVAGPSETNIEIEIDGIIDGIDKLDRLENPSSINMVGMTVVFSGFRDSGLQNQIEARGGKVGSAVSKNTTMLIMKDIKDVKGKGNKALELGIKIISKDDFVRQYIN